MYAYTIIGSAEFQSVSVDIYAIKSGVDIGNKEKFYRGYAEWLNAAIPALINGRSAFVTAAKNGEVVAYMAYSERENDIEVTEINTVLPSDSIGRVLIGMCASIAKAHKNFTECFIFDNTVMIPLGCDELVPCGVVDGVVKYRYNEI